MSDVSNDSAVAPQAPVSDSSQPSVQDNVPQAPVVDVNVPQDNTPATPQATPQAPADVPADASVDQAADGSASPQDGPVPPLVRNNVPNTPQVAVSDVPSKPVLSSPTANTKKKMNAQPADLRLNADQVTQIVSCIKDILNGRKPSTGAMLRIVANCLESSRQMNLKPDLAKKLISHAMESYLREPETGLDEDEIQTLMAAADVAINEGIDVLDDVSKRNINVGPKSCCTIM